MLLSNTITFQSHLRVRCVLFGCLDCALCTDSSVTADIHTARLVVKVSIKPHLYKKKEYHKSSITSLDHSRVIGPFSEIAKQ